MIAGRQAGHARADLLHDPRPLVAKHHWQRGGMNALSDVEVGVADPAGRHPNLQLTSPRRIELEFLYDQWLPELVQDSGPGPGRHRD
jgi:hypothetical protein